MIFQSNPEAIPFVVAALIAGGLARFAWQEAQAADGPGVRHDDGRRGYLGTLRGARAGVRRPPDQENMLRLSGSPARSPRCSACSRSCSATPAMFAGWRGTGSGRSAPRRSSWSSLAWTDQWHHLYWTRFANATIGGFKIAAPECGPGFWAAIAFFYTIVGLSIFLLAQAVARIAGVYRAQAAVMLFGVLVPSVIDLLDWSRSFLVHPRRYRCRSPSC